jgi:hypothetical protein
VRSPPCARPRRQLASSAEQQEATDALLSACRQQLQRQEALAAELSQQLQLTQGELLAKLQVERDTAARQIAELQLVGFSVPFPSPEESCTWPLAFRNWRGGVPLHDAHPALLSPPPGRRLACLPTAPPPPQQAERGALAAEQLAELREAHEVLRLAGLGEAQQRALAADELARARAELAAAQAGEERWRGLLVGARSRAEHAEELVRGSEAALEEARGELGELRAAVLRCAPLSAAVRRLGGAGSAAAAAAPAASLLLARE